MFSMFQIIFVLKRNAFNWYFNWAGLDKHSFNLSPSFDLARDATRERERALARVSVTVDNAAFPLIPL